MSFLEWHRGNRKGASDARREIWKRLRVLCLDSPGKVFKNDEDARAVYEAAGSQPRRKRSGYFGALMTSGGSKGGMKKKKNNFAQMKF